MALFNRNMKYKFVICYVITLILTVFFFPATTIRSISGDGQVLTNNKEVLGDCILSIEIKEVSSLAFCYSKQFSFVLDGRGFSEFYSGSHDEAKEGLCSITQIYYDEDENRGRACTLVYQNDLSYAVISWNDKLYFINPGLSIPPSKIPFSRIPSS